MKLKTILATAGAGVLALLGAKATLFTVDETEQVVVTQFGKPVNVVKEPGLHAKIPFIQSVTRFDDRVLEYDDAARDVPTQDKKYIKTNNYSRWRIGDPLKFMQTVRSETGAQARLDDIIYSAVREGVGSHNFIEIVRSTNREMQSTEMTSEGERSVAEEVKVGRAKIMAEVTEDSRVSAGEYGIKIIDVRLKRTDLPKETEASVYARMIAERSKISERYRSEGEGEKRRIEGQKELELSTILSGAYMRAQKIKGEADAEAIRIYAKAFEKDPAFYAFLRTLEAWEKTAGKSETTLVITTDSEFFKLMKYISEKK